MADVTANRGYPLPHHDNVAYEDADRIRAALQAVDEDVAELQETASEAVAGRVRLATAEEANAGTSLIVAPSVKRTHDMIAGRIEALVGAAPAVLDTIAELASAIINNQDAISAINAAIASKLSKASNLSDLADVAAARTALGLGTAALLSATALATAAQGAKADSALQPSAIGVSVLAPNGDGANLTGIVSVPIGGTIYVNGTVAPTNFIKENGTLLARVGPYDMLWAYAQVSGNLVSDAAWSANRSAFSTGTDGTNFRIPDSRGLFIRGLDDGAGFDSGRTIGSYQDMMIQSHYHGIPYTPGNLAGGSGGNMIFGGGALGNTDAVGGAETRPRNVAKLACIRYR